MTNPRALIRKVMAAVLVLASIYILTPVFYLVGYIVEGLVVFAVNTTFKILTGVVQIVNYLLVKCKGLIEFCMPSFVDCFGDGDEVKIIIGFIACVSLLAYLKLRLGKGGQHEQD